ncbi:hypothetical protein Tco_1310426 [Tanacetum coccineum]
MIEGNGPKWLFNIDSLTQSLNYVPVAVSTITNESASTQGELNTGTSTQKEEISQDCIVMPIWKDASYFDSPSKDVGNGEQKFAANDQKQVEDGLDNENNEKDKYEDDSSPKEVNTAGQHVNIASPEVNTGRFKLNTVDPSVNTASLYDQDSPKDMFIMGASHTLEATHVEFFSDKVAAEDSSKQGKKISDINTDPIISLVQPQQDMEYDFDISIAEGFTTASIPITTAGLEISTANIAVSTADVAVTTTSASISTVSPPRVSTAEDISGAETLVYIRRSASKAKDKGKAIMQESEPLKKIKKRVQLQMSVDEELVKKVFEEEQARFKAEQEARLKVEQEQERIDFETALELQRQLDEREEVVAKEAHDIDWCDPFVLRYHALQNRPFSVAEVRKNMCMYLKNQGGYKMSHFKGKSYEEIRPIFERVWDQIQSFVLMDSKKEKDSKKKTKGRLKRTGQDVVEEPDKRQNTIEASESVQEQPSEEPKADELSQEQLQQMMLIVPEEGMHIEALQIKYPIIDWEVHFEDTMKFWKIIRLGNHTDVYQVFEDMLKNFNGQTLEFS